jgi:hypothetical protein
MDESNNHAAPQEAENFPCDEALISLIADILKAEQQLREQAVALNAQKNGALVLFIRQHKLAGNWQLAENGRELVKQREASPIEKA